MAEHGQRPAQQIPHLCRTTGAIRRWPSLTLLPGWAITRAESGLRKAAAPPTLSNNQIAGSEATCRPRFGASTVSAGLTAWRAASGEVGSNQAGIVGAPRGTQIGQVGRQGRAGAAPRAGRITSRHQNRA